MIGCASLGTNDLQRATAFYDALPVEIGAKRTMDLGRGYAWGVAMDKPLLGIMKPFDGQPATAGNGVMVAFAVNSRELVDRVCAKALAPGTKDEGPAGPRGEILYASYFRDVGGNKPNVLCMG